MRIALFYHALFYMGDPPRLLPGATPIVLDQMLLIKKSGLLDALDLFVVGINGSDESASRVKLCIPPKAKVIMHGLSSYSENLTLIEREKWIANLPMDDDWAVLYAHSKGASHIVGSDYAKFAGKWRNCMDHHCITNWTQAVMDLMAGYEAVGCHWMSGQGWDHSQHYFAGNEYWSKASFLRTIPSMFTRQRIKDSGIASAASRYEAEIIIGNGPKKPITKDYCTAGLLKCSA